MKKRFIFALVAILIILSLLPMSANAASNTYSEAYGNSVIYMHDMADLLTDSEEEALIQKIGTKCQNIHYNILFLTTNDSDGKSTMVYSDDYMDDLFPTYEHNIAFVIDMDNREIYINTMGNAILCLTDKMINVGLDRGYEYIVEEQYGNCMEAMASYCVTRLNDNPGAGTVDSPIAVDGFWETFGDAMIGSVVLAIAATAGAVVLLIVKHNAANKAQKATTYMAKEDYHILDKDEIFVRSYETVQRDYYKPRSSSSGGRSSGGSSHRSSSGRSHGGGGRRF